MKHAGIVVGLAILGALAAAPASAEHMTLMPSPERPDAARGRPDVTLDLDLKVGADGFRLGGRVLGADGVRGAWLDGRRRRDGFRLEGRVQGDRAYGFTLDTEIVGPRAALRWWLREP